MQYAALGAYGLAAAIHLFACANRTQLKLRRITKCFLMPLLALCYVLLARTVSPLVVAAILSGFAGDVVLLMRPRRWAFPAGIAAFAAGHVFYIVSFLNATPRFPAWYVFALLGVVTVACAVLLIRALWKGIPKRLRPPGFAYMLIIGSMASAALIFAFAGGSRFGWLAALGGALFVASDTTLAIDAFHHPVHHRNVIVMSTYIAAQTLLVSALALV
ncbi:MAG: lysoplasmalogenase [Clostridiales bacterium]|nr:lysoplasmalogenase [Clostridiales bacterium]